MSLHSSPEAPRFSSHVPESVQEALADIPIRSYQSQDYPYLDVWMRSLATFYDGHSEDNKLLDQLVGTEEADPRGFFTTKKALLVSVDEESGMPTGALCLNYKRGGAVKIGPVVVDGNLRGRGIGKNLFVAADIFAETVEARKLYATTSHLNSPVNSLFERYGYNVEATFPDQYKSGSEELVWGKFTAGHPVGNSAVVESLLLPSTDPVVRIDAYDDEDRRFVAGINHTFQGWHDDLGEDFIDGMVAGHERGLSFQEKGKIILLGKTALGKSAGLLTFTPKRGGPVKLYPVAGSPEAQTMLIERAVAIAKDHGNHKLYTFVHEQDQAEQAFLLEKGFTKRGTLLSPYKDGHNLDAFDKMVA